MFWKNLPDETTPRNAENLSRSERYLQATAGANGDFYVNIDGADGLANGDTLKISFPTATNGTSNARLSIDGGSNYNFIAINENIKKAESVENDKLELVYDGENWQIILTSGNILRPDDSTVEEGLQALEKIEIVTDEIKPTNEWVDGKQVYSKRIYLGEMPNNTVKYVPTGLIANNIYITKIEGTARRKENAFTVPLPYPDEGNNYQYISYETGSSNPNTIRIATGSDRSDYVGYVNIYFTYID
jgi:hypothetical protein